VKKLRNWRLVVFSRRLSQGARARGDQEGESADGYAELPKSPERRLDGVDGLMCECSHFLIMVVGFVLSDDLTA
jgi:hypothetical protein